MRAAILSVLFAVGLQAAPLSDTIPFPTDFLYAAQQRANKIQYSISYTSVWGGKWNLAGTAIYGNSQIKENFSGTISNTNINGTFTEANGTLSWASDTYTILDRYEEPKMALTFKLVISNGTMTGTATYLPE